MNGGGNEFSRECPWRDSATLHLLGQLAPEDSGAYLEHVGGCTPCERELEQARVAVAEVDLAIARDELALGRATSPSPEVRRKLLERVAAETNAVETNAVETQDRAEPLDRTWKRWAAVPPPGATVGVFGPGLYAVAAEAGAWESVGIEGIEVKRLAVDPARRSVTMLVRMGPGTAYPAHRHGGDEECFVIAGEVDVGGRRLRAGDYQKAGAGSRHEVQSTEKGCLLFIVSSQDDELLES